MPVRILTIVDLPAPFSPIRAVTWPGKSVRWASCSARTPGNRFDTPARDRRGLTPSPVRARGRDEGRSGSPGRPGGLLSIVEAGGPGAITPAPLPPGRGALV